METYKVVASEDQIRKFYTEVLAPLQEDESYFFAMSARNKKLNEEERQLYKIGRSEMMKKQFVRYDEGGRTIEHIVSRIYSYECNKKGMLTQNGSEYPEKALVLYGSINPSSDSECVGESMKYAVQIMIELMASAKKGSAKGIQDQITKFSKAHSKTKENHPHLPSRKVLMDFDADVDIPEEVEYEFFEDLKKEMREFIKSKTNDLYTPTFIRTAGGFHMLVRKEVVKYNPNELVSIIEKICDKYKIVSKEIKKNDNNMVPIPGTYQYGVPVYIV